jgi:hypothetical protein
MNKFKTKNQTIKDARFKRLKSTKSRAKLKKIKSLIVNGGSIFINKKPRTELERALNFGVDN